MHFIKLHRMFLFVSASFKLQCHGHISENMLNENNIGYVVGVHICTASQFRVATGSGYVAWAIESWSTPLHL